MAIPSCQNCTIGNPPNTPNAGFNPFFTTPGWSQGVTASTPNPAPVLGAPTSTPSWNAQGASIPPVSWPRSIATLGGVPPPASQRFPAALSQGSFNQQQAWNPPAMQPVAAEGQPPYGGPSEPGGPGGPALPKGTPFFNTGDNPGGGFPSGGYGNAYVPVQAPFGMLSHIKNAVRMIQPFYSDESSVEKVRALWGALERVTVVLAVKRSESV
ncbi:hypothetical protein PI124_g21496 [Phytophthora idaei]|nr:hypothetical protein PI125_g22902 [Phytophthora idaei]KAG3129410.1 hypothetical protein PI126_g20978 [Phytophthora idaei]KAG3233431.1 hypothetical protein PI124_g21496 [Phytophthora idaei]